MTSIIEHVGINQGLSPWSVLIGTLGKPYMPLAQQEPCRRGHNIADQQAAIYETNRQRIIDFLQMEGPLKASQIGRALRMRPPTVRQHMRKLVQDQIATVALVGNVMWWTYKDQS